MMNRADRLILFMVFLCGLICFCPPLLAQGAADDPIANRPLPEYKSSGMRDPFQTYIIKDKALIPIAQPQSGELPKSQTNFNELIVQGIIWGAKVPQAIINNKIYIVGDKIEDSEIVSIDKGGVNLSSPIGIVNLPAPGKNTALNKDNYDNKEVK
ncbi:MAG: hypothetical protein PHR84_06015 [Candidatus Omnitrophica bacterium]|jgi:hypothetical protein|nr:hypothetical protein [Candidatus Omnitrophota bacterium]MDD5661310.1 hypothetical protein [Candidatus Omnitrophota bacterium]